MDIITSLLLLIWLALGVLVVRFVVRTGGTTVGRVAHWFGGVFVMFGLAVAMLLIFASLSASFAVKLNVYMETHLIARGNPGLIVRIDQPGDHVTVYRHAEVNNEATLDGATLTVDETNTVHTSWWWLLWDTKYDQNSGTAK